MHSKAGSKNTSQKGFPAQPRQGRRAVQPECTSSACYMQHAKCALLQTLGSLQHSVEPAITTPCIAASSWQSNLPSYQVLPRGNPRTACSYNAHQGINRVRHAHVAIETASRRMGAPLASSLHYTLPLCQLLPTKCQYFTSHTHSGLGTCSRDAPHPQAAAAEPLQKPTPSGHRCCSRQVCPSNAAMQLCHWQARDPNGVLGQGLPVAETFGYIWRWRYGQGRPLASPLASAILPRS